MMLTQYFENKFFQFQLQMLFTSNDRNLEKSGRLVAVAEIAPDLLTPRHRQSKRNARNKSSVARVLAEGGHGGDKNNPVEANLAEPSHLFPKLRSYPSIWTSDYVAIFIDPHVNEMTSRYLHLPRNDNTYEIISSECLVSHMQKIEGIYSIAMADAN